MPMVAGRWLHGNLSECFRFPHQFEMKAFWILKTLFKWFRKVFKYFKYCQVFSLVGRFTNRDWPYHQTCLSWDLLDLFFQKGQNYHRHHRIVFPWLELPNYKFQHFQPAYCVSPGYIVVPKVLASRWECNQELSKFNLPLVGILEWKKH